MPENRLPAARPRRGVISISLVLAVSLLVLLVQLLLAQGGETQDNEGSSANNDDRTPGTTIGATGGVTESIYMPLLNRSIAAVLLSATRPNSTNQWTVSWTSGGSGITGYHLQESKSPDFAIISNEYTLGNVTSHQITRPLVVDNVYFYRVRAMVGTQNSPWSNIAVVRGGYYDDFTNPSTGWTPMRRTTFLERTNVYYGQGDEFGNLIILVDDRWDWMIASPLRPAPEIPYAIEFKARVHDPSNLISGGMLFAGDWGGLPCPDPNNIYQHGNCFNSFYNLNMIFYGPIKLLYEQVDQLIWCPECGGSPMKRYGPFVDAGDIVANGPSLDWHTYRIEVRHDGVRFFVNGAYRFYFPDTSHLQQPYFGVFASTDEYKPSIWFFDYVMAVPLD
ncbi:MAG: fibronectin type III domain-containing protein [Anaerolineae bacterium]|nr:fibronectin type III domain-containing protein [Anaerolineae bacterium]